MGFFNMHIFKKWISTVAVAIALVAQPVWGAYEFSDYGFVRNEARTDNNLRVEMRGRAALRSYRFVGRVGGVNFQSIVDLAGAVVVLNYNPSLQDGERAIAIIDGVEAKIPLYDWQLGPIVDYSDSNDTAVVSIFGEPPDGETGEDHYYIDYHPAFLDTHIGARLMQADIVLMDIVSFSEAPSNPDHPKFLPGESPATDIVTRFSLAAELSEVMESAAYQAWVLTDVDEIPSFGIVNGVLEISLEPYYHFWRSENNSDADIAEYEQLISRFNSIVDARNAAYDRYLNAPSGSSDETVARQIVERADEELDDLDSRISNLEAKLEAYEPEVFDVPSLSANIRQKNSELRAAVPFVYEAVDATAEFSAFFRAVRESNPDSWERFSTKVDGAVVLLPTTVPNQFDRNPGPAN